MHKDRMVAVKEKIVLIIASVLGLGAFVTFVLGQPIATLFEKAEANTLSTTFAEGQSCTPYAQDYMKTLHDQADKEVYIAGCGGVL